MLDIEALRRDLQTAFERGLLARADFVSCVTEEDVAAIETALGVALPTDFRRSCIEVASTAPAPFPPLTGREGIFEVYVDQGDGSPDVVNLLDDARSESLARLRRPFPFTARWCRTLPTRAFGTRLITQASSDDFDRCTSLEGLPESASPFDGWLELWGELQYCDTWFIAYGLILTGPSRGF